MRFMMMHKNDSQTEAGELPPPELIQKVGAYIGEHAQRGTFLGGEGLGRSATRTRLTFRGGQCRVKHGPYAGEHELPAAVLVLAVKTREEGVGWAERYGKILGDGELELAPVNEPWDLGFGAKPEGAPLRLLLVEKADAASEAGTRSAKQKAELTRLRTEMTKAGVLGSTLALAPSARGKRLVFTSNALRVIDGPFAESKELIGGFAILELPSLDEAIAECRRYAEILGGTLEVDIRAIEE
ncbi:MAG: YciI family protein [Deltaproteobacteria bacterium]|nr:YciI family protein [Kofleriaceae bacterium]